MGCFRPILNHFGITEQQWRVIRALDERDELEPRELCDVCQILSPSLTGVLARMEALGLIEQRRVETDLRRRKVVLTASGRAMVEDMAPLIEAQYRELENALGKTLVTDLYLMLGRVLARRDCEIPLVPLPGTASTAPPGEDAAD